MNKKIIIVGSVLLAIIVTSYAYSMAKNNTSSDGQNTTSTSELVSEAAEFAAAVQSGKPTVCTLTKDGENMEYQIKGKMMRVNMTVSTPVPNAGPMITKSHMINDGSYLYMWTDDQKQGTKMSLTEPSPISNPSSVPAVSQEQTPKLESESDYDNLKNQGYTISCQAGSVSEADFIPPTNIQFIDPTEMMKQIPQTQGSRVDMEKWQQQYGSMMPQDNE